MALTITTVKRFKPLRGGIRRGLVDITFNTDGPTWVVTAAEFKLNVLLDLRLPAHVSGFVLGFDAATLTIDARQEESTAAGGALLAAGATDLDTLVVRAEYIGS